MFVTVKLYGTLRRLSQPGTPGLWQGEVPPQTRVSDLIHLLGSRPAEVAGACINKEVCSLEAKIPPGAEVMLVTHVGGG